MSDGSPSLKQLNRTFIGSVLCADIAGFTACPEAEQLELKELFNTMLADAVHGLPPSERVMVDTGHGAAIAFLGDPEDALFAALALRDAIAAAALPAGEPGFVRIGINLGPLKFVRDINGQTSMVGNGVTDAQRALRLAAAGQLMVTFAYFDMISRIARDYMPLFVYVSQDRLADEQEVFRFDPPADNAALTDVLHHRAEMRQLRPDDAPSSTVVIATRAEDVSTAGKREKHAWLRPATSVAAGVSVLMAGAVWLWTDKPTQAPVTASVTAYSRGSTKDTSYRPRIEPAKAADIRADVKLAATNPHAVLRASSSSAASDKTEDNAKLPAPPVVTGAVKLAIQPWGEIFVDGARRGVSPPMKSLSLAPGKHHIEIRNGDFAPYRETVEVRSGGEVTVEYAF
ncbi:PEGA domain-containing protein [Noviherbaspirillum denitrificans]|uniref:PEGA domain-containing protein n=1 Tax=Noviherbaspirillum denitrificans TaxID=1968433 RepID=A0A254TSA3_9BURK|nr:PEGA domain-containing protein [Noviherbaspirillum denitrificans]OWW22608.1 hypothetical protein AYR66_27010 [Noviherbaspirillum denitrificans]